MLLALADFLLQLGYQLAEVLVLGGKRDLWDCLALGAVGGWCLLGLVTVGGGIVWFIGGAWLIILVSVIVGVLGCVSAIVMVLVGIAIILVGL
jgi:hypothetical protein